MELENTTEICLWKRSLDDPAGTTKVKLARSISDECAPRHRQAVMCEQCDGTKEYAQKLNCELYNP